MNAAANQVATAVRGALEHPPRAGCDAFASTLTRDYPGLTSLLRRHARDPQLAADILHDAIVTTLTKMGSATVSPTPDIAGYVFRTAMNHLRNHRRRERLRAGDPATVEDSASDTPSPEQQADQDANARAVRRVLHALASSRDREVLVRFYLYEESKQDICATLGLGELAFNRIIFRARERARQLLENTGMRRTDLLTLFAVVSLLTIVRYC